MPMLTRSFIFKLLATLLLFYIPVTPLTNSILYSLRARSTPSTLYTFSGAFLAFAILKLHGILNLSSCGNAYTDSVRSVCAVLTADYYRQIISARRSQLASSDRTTAQWSDCAAVCGRLLVRPHGIDFFNGKYLFFVNSMISSNKIQ